MGDNKQPSKQQPQRKQSESPKNAEHPDTREQSSQNETREGGDVQYVDRGGRLDRPEQDD